MLGRRCSKLSRSDLKERNSQDQECEKFVIQHVSMKISQHENKKNDDKGISLILNLYRVISI